MESEFLYRYIGFETFVDMVQKNALTFVLPSVWDDPQEESPFIQMVKKRESGIDRAFLLAMRNKIYAQSWSELAESDAMWRIYAYNSRALRIKVSRDKIDLLDTVKVVPVTYSDEPFDYEKFDEYAFFTSLAYKRTAFAHEKEVRLIAQYLYRDEEDAKQHIKALLIINEHPDMIKLLESMYPGLELEEKVAKIAELLNMGNSCTQTKAVSFSHITEFISGVMVHPMAPEWYVEVVQEFCRRNNIPFEGKSALYQVME